LRPQVADTLRRAGLKAATGQDHSASVNIHDALRGLRPYPLDAPLGRGQEIYHQRIVDHANAPPFSGTEQSLRQARATIPELDHGARWKVDAPTLAPGRLVQLKTHPQALHPAQRRVGVVHQYTGESRVRLALGHAHNILGIRLRRVRLHVQAGDLSLTQVG